MCTGHKAGLPRLKKKCRHTALSSVKPAPQLPVRQVIRTQSRMRPTSMRVKRHFWRTRGLGATLTVFAVLSAHAVGAQPSTDPLATARGLLDQGKLTESERAIGSYLEGNPDSADAHFLLGFVLFREKKARDSLAEFTAGAKFRRPGVEELK